MLGGPLRSAYLNHRILLYLTLILYLFSLDSIFRYIRESRCVLNYIHMNNPGSRSDFEQTLSVFLKMTYKLSTFIRVSVFNILAQDN